MQKYIVTIEYRVFHFKKGKYRVIHL